jgi:Kdo2-lipid IVA lauroyltransferase/acyltransferase
VVAPTPPPAPPAPEPEGTPAAPPAPRRAGRALVRAALATLLPALGALPWRAALAVGAGIGRLAHLVQPRRRRRAREGLERALGDRLKPAEIRRLEREVFIGLGRNLAELAWVAADPSRVDRVVGMEGVEHLRAALDAGRGVVLITGHLGSWELMAAAIVRHGFPLSVIAREANDGKVNELLVGLRARFGVRTLLRGSAGAARGILRTLRSGEVLGCLIDQDIKAEGVFVEFFGRPAFTPSGPAALALRGNAPVVVGATWRLPDGTHRVRFDPPWRLDRGADPEADIARHTASLTRWLEERIREHPAQWVWIHRRWRRQPPPGTAAAGPSPAD